MNAQTGHGARASLAQWATEPDDWIHWIVGEVLAGGRPLGEAAIDEAYRRLLAEKSLSNEEFAPTEALVPQVNGEGPEGALSLRSVEDCTSVNALAPGQRIEFNPRLTVLFGENASGKSGYVRILKRLGNVRSAEPVLGNVYAEANQVEPSARIVFALGDDEQTLEWRNEEGVPPFTRMGVFDARASAIHVDTDLTYVFTPADLALFTHAHAAIETVRDRAEAASADARPRSNPFLARFQRGTSVYREVETLGASSDLAALTGLAAVPDDVEVELNRRRARVEALRPEAVSARLEIAQNDHQLYQSVVSVCESAASFDADSYASALAEAVASEARYEQVTADFVTGTAIAAPIDVWEQFVRAGEAVLQSLDRDEYPQNGDECIYCRQELRDDALATVRTYRAWVNDESAGARDDARLRAFQIAAPIRGLPLAQVAERLAAKSSALGDELPPAITAATKLIPAISTAVQAAEDGRDIDWEPVRLLTNALRPLAVRALENAADVVEALEAQESERTQAFEAESGELAELEASATLAALLPEIRSYVERARWSDRLTTVLRPIRSVLRSLTETAKEASDELLNKGFEQQFEREIEILRAPRIRLDFPGRRGQAARRKVLVPEHRLSEILSEGEQKVIALADFLSESALKVTSAPLVFDDPVTSLDYKRLEHVVDRLVSLSDEHQVIVFTHNIWFAVELLRRFENKPNACAYFDISRTEVETGIVTGGTHPRADTVTRLKAEINTLMQDAETATGESRAALIERAYDKIRAWCEVTVEEEILQGVTKRYQPNVQMTKLVKIKAARLDDVTGVLTALFEKACRVMGGHSQPLETLAVRPSLDELKKDWEEGQAALAAYRAD